MKYYLSFLFLFFVGAVAQAQIGGGRFYTFPVDTLDDTATLNFQYDKDLEDDYLFSWQITATELSGDTDITCYLQERMSSLHTWVNRDTMTFDTTESFIITGTNLAPQQRCSCTGTGTHSTKLQTTPWWRRKKL